MRARNVFVLAILALGLTQLMFADSLIGSSGADWQTWNTSVLLANNGSPYWNGASSDGTNENIGDCIDNANGCHNLMLNSPATNLDYWGMTNGTADSAFTFVKDSDSSDATMEVEIAGNAGINEFGWYDTSNSSVLNVLFTGPDSKGAVASFTPSASYGFWFEGSQGIYFTNSALNTDGAPTGEQHFAAFGQNLSAAGEENYWLGMEDLNFSGSDKDYNDMVVEVTGVPEPASILLLGTLVLFGARWGRRRLHS